MELTGQHLIAGNWVEGGSRFISSRVHRDGHSVCDGNADAVDQACQAAEEAFWSYSATSAKTRAALLNAIADEIDERGSAITTIGAAETGLPEARLEGERGRTTGQLKLFASHILKGDYLDARHDAALPDRTPLPRPDLRLIQCPVGPVAVFGASNFPVGLFNGGRRHGSRFGCRVPGCCQRAPRASRHVRDRGGCDPSSDFVNRCAFRDLQPGSKLRC